MKDHFWFGEMINDEELEKILTQEFSWASCRDNFNSSALISSISKWSKSVESEFGAIIDRDYLRELLEFCDEKSLKGKVVKELGSFDSLVMRRVDYENSFFEKRSPLGVLTHILPGNSEGLSFLAAIEGLLVGNINIIKLAQSESTLAIELSKSLIKSDSTGFVKNRLSFLRLPSASPLLDKVIRLSQGVSAWGGDNALVSIRSKMSAQTSFIPWGHKISFGLVSSSSGSQKQMEELAADVIDLNQQACSSPQVIFYECTSENELREFAERLFPFLTHASRLKGALVLDDMERAELQNESLVYQFMESQGEAFMLQADDVRLYGKMDSELLPSPLNRTIHLRPISKKGLSKTLFHWREYLQTCGLVSKDQMDFLDWSNYLLEAGISRVCLPGKMVQSYAGEPHDGQFALERFTKTVRIELPGVCNQSTLFTTPLAKPIDSSILMDKEDFQNQEDLGLGTLYFKSGGSSGEPKISRFSYADYYSQMQAAADGLIAGGFEPTRDRVANLFFGGCLYGGFSSFTTILEKLKAVQLPMGAIEDYQFLTSQITSLKVNTLFGMPSYIFQYLKDQESELKKYGGISKIFYGGEHFSSGQRKWMEETFGFSLIKSASYGSVDAGPIGFQCLHSTGGVHHLNDQLQVLEVLEINSDKPVGINEIGRLVVTTPAREAMKVERYDIGDLGRWVPEKCKCGSSSPRFELLGRSGDVFRAAGNFLNYRKFEFILGDLGYSSEFQVKIESSGERDSVTLVLSSDTAIELSCDKMIFLDNIKELREAVIDEGVLDFSIEYKESSDLERVKSSGKLRRVIDNRTYGSL
jgi:phenylacetate-coenzyme A ligase PaaK-like adenylate-forming protein